MAKGHAKAFENIRPSKTSSFHKAMDAGQKMAPHQAFHSHSLSRPAAASLAAAKRALSDIIFTSSFYAGEGERLMGLRDFF
ncbi:hypothetical protein [Pararhizobium sp. DWP3-4]|uniref:hypothetical protein n=1 Tax=Pararhizobium sp. DWP3-4 TaxID=2804565 RepID=UPI003CF8E0FC